MWNVTWVGLNVLIIILRRSRVQMDGGGSCVSGMLVCLMLRMSALAFNAGRGRGVGQDLRECFSVHVDGLGGGTSKVVTMAERAAGGRRRRR